MRVLVLGDSYAAGNGAGDYYGAASCYRSHQNYAEVLAGIGRNAPYDRTVTVANHACSGAATADFANSQDGKPPQASTVDSRADLVLLTVGGNDVGLAGIVKACLVPGTRDGAACEPLLGRAEALVSDGTLQQRVTDVLRQIRSRAKPSARVELVGYPYLEGDPDYTLHSGHGASPPTVQVGARLRALQDSLDAAEQAAVDTIGNEDIGTSNRFVSVETLFSGPPYHGLYAEKANKNRWLIAPYVDAPVAARTTWYHPNPTGWSQEGHLLAATTDAFVSRGTAGLLAGDQDNFGYGAGNTVPCIFFDQSGPNDLGVFDSESPDSTQVKRWRHSFQRRLPAGFTAATLRITISEVFSDTTVSTVSFDGIRYTFAKAPFSKCNGPQTRVFTLTGRDATIADDGVIDVDFSENGDNIALDYSKVRIVGTDGTVIT